MGDVQLSDVRNRILKVQRVRFFNNLPSEIGFLKFIFCCKLMQK